MREILFRGKRKDNGEWIKGDLLQYLASGKMYIVRYCFGAGGVEIIPKTVGQYTGLCDKNCTKIFEADIVTGLFDHGIGINAIIAFHGGAFGLLANQHDVEYFYPFTSLCNIEYEVIGNIHDNPELVKGSE